MFLGLGNTLDAMMLLRTSNMSHMYVAIQEEETWLLMAPWNLKKLIDFYLHESLSKDDDARISSWSSSTLSMYQITHACLYAMKSL